MSLDDLMETGGTEKVMEAAASSGAPLIGMQSPDFLAYFDHVTKQLSKVSTGTKMAVVGEEEVGKTHFITTMPKPITAMCTDSRFMEILFAIMRRANKNTIRGKSGQQVLKLFKEWLIDKEYYIYHAVKIDIGTQQPDYVESVKEFEKVLGIVAKHVDQGSFVIDNTSDLRLWLNALVDKEARFTNETTGMPYRFEWGAANGMVRKMTETFREKKIHFCMTAHTKPKFSTGGKEVKGQTDIVWNKNTSGDLDLILEGRKLRSATVTGGAGIRDDVGPYLRAWNIRKCTKWPDYQHLAGQSGMLLNVTWESLREDVLNKVGFDIEEIQE